MKIAIDPASPTGATSTAEDWHRMRRDDIAACIVCGEDVMRRPRHGGGTLHFYHLKGSNCPTIPGASNRYHLLRALPRDPSLAKANRAYVFDNLIGIHDRMKELLGTIRIADTLKMCKAATRENVWSLKDMPVEMLPYVLLSCMDQFPPLGNRLHPIYFVIQAPQDPSKYWNFPPNYARHILMVNAADPTQFEAKLMSRSPPVNSIVEELRAMLT
ncbi:hypothetical protein G3N90_20570 [Xanthomonas hortorum pv. gardneri]|uniref:hypothetical protein n=1 Tax=Xanthomonas hortorum TaxID=56454 RepID=UPI002FDF3896